MLRAVIFDFDGVITDSETLHFRAFNEVLKPYGCELTKQQYYQTYLGLTDIDCYKLLIEQGRLNVDVGELPQLVASKTAVFEQLARMEGQIIEGVRDFLGMLQEHGMPMAICSGALRAEIEMILEQAGLRNIFGPIISAEQVSKGKPDPQGFLLTVEELRAKGLPNVESGQCIVIEDSHWGLKAARAAGMRVVAVTNTYDADQLRDADRVVDRLNELSMNDLYALCQ